jgi:hypothetical protein
MAEIVQSLFGVTPEMYQQNQQAQADQQALQYAKLSPFEQANFAIGRGATMLGGAIGRGLGGEDPELARVTARQQISRQINYADPASIAKGVEMLSAAGDTQGAMMLADVVRKAESEKALALQRTAQANRETRQAVPNDIQIANEIATLTDAQDQLMNQPASPDRDRAINLLTTRLTELNRLTTKPEKDLRYGTDRESISAELYDKSFSQLTTTERAIVNKRVEEEQGKKARESAPKIYTPGQQIAPKDWMDFSKNILSGDPVMQRTSTILSDAPSAIDIIRNSTSNDFAAASLPSSIARLTGEGKNMSNADVNRFARTGGLDDRLAQDAVKFFTGGTTEVKKDQAERFAIALYRGALIERRKKLETSAEEFGYSTSPNYKSALKNIDDQLSQFKLVKKGESTPSTQKTGNPLIDKYLSPAVEK